MDAWSQVQGHGFDSSIALQTLKLGDTASGEIREIVRKPQYRMYVCGITPYDATHLGHAATYLTFDLINRYLTAMGSTVHYVQNITDIDDPLLERAVRDRVDWLDLAHAQIELFRGDMVALRVIPPINYIGAVEAIPLVIEAIEKLKDKGHVYKVESDLYFSIASDTEFGSRSHLTRIEMETIFADRGGDPERSGKKDPLDPRLWMSQRPGEPGWDSPFGIGRPGWHIECTAIALEFLQPSSSENELIDIQGGGSDLVFPHHEMCASQAYLLTGKELASAYVHSGMIGLDGEKMSKSRGNLIFVSRLLATGVDPMSIRWALMKDHYASDRMWSEDLLHHAQIELDQLRKALSNKECAPTSVLIESIVSELSNNLNTPNVVSLLNRWSSSTPQEATGGDRQQLLEVLDSLLGLKL